MKTTKKFKALGIAAVAAGALAASSANALVIGYTSLKVEDFGITAGGDLIDTVSAITNTIGTTSGFNGTNVGGTTPGFDRAQACVSSGGACAGFVENTFTQLGTSPATIMESFARGDATIDAAGNILTSDAGAESVGEVQLGFAGNFQGDGGSTASTGATVEIEILAGGTGTIDFSLLATLNKFLFSDEAGSFVQATSSWTFTRRNTSTNVSQVRTPNEANALEQLVGPGTVDLTGATPQLASFSFDVEDGQTYRLSLVHTSNVLATRPVPVPATLGLLGLGMLGLGAAARRRRAS